MRTLTTLLFATTLLGDIATAADLPQATLAQMADVQGTYALSNGQRARIFIMDSRLLLDTGRQYKELELAGSDRWVTRDRTFSLQFSPGQAPDQLVLHIRSDAPDAAPIRLALNSRRGRGSSGN